jgi:hypothetical protein
MICVHTLSSFFIAAVFLLFKRPFFVQYIAYSMSAGLCSYLIFRHILNAVGFIDENKISATKQSFSICSWLVSVFSACGLIPLFMQNKFSGMVCASALMLGSRIGDYRNISARERRSAPR